MAAKTECDRCGRVFDAMQEGSSCVSVVVHGKVKADRGMYNNYDYCPVCAGTINVRLEVLNAEI